VFAVVQVYGERVDGRIAAWGMAFEDHVEVFDVDGGLPMTRQTPEDALPGFAWGRHITTRLVWVNPAAATPAEHDEEGRRGDGEELVTSVGRARARRW